MKPETKWKKKLKEIRDLAKSAMTDKPEYKPQKGFKFIKDVEVGQLVTTESGLRGIVIEHTDTATVVYCTEVDRHTEDRKFYYGRHRWSGHTEVKLI